MSAAANSTPALPATTSLEQLELRLAELELRVGTTLHSDSSPTQKIDITSRLDNLLRIETNRIPPTPPTAKASDASLDTKRAALHQEFRTIDRLLSELAMSPLAGPAASVGGNSNAPLLFRRQEILASSDSMKRDMELLSRIRELTMMGVKVATNDSNKSSNTTIESKVVNCPIIASERYDLPSDPDAKERLERLCFRVAELHKRTTTVSIRANRMLDSYAQVMKALSEKMVLAEEQISRR